MAIDYFSRTQSILYCPFSQAMFFFLFTSKFLLPTSTSSTMEDTTSIKVVLYFFNQTCSYFILNVTSLLILKHVIFACAVKCAYSNNSTTVQRRVTKATLRRTKMLVMGLKCTVDIRTYPTHIQTLMSV